MSENTIMFEKFEQLLGAEKGTLMAGLGKPAASFPAFAIYHRNKLWMVLYFSEERQEGILHSVLKGVTFFDDGLHLLWNAGVQVIPDPDADGEKDLTTLSAWFDRYGEPHALFGGSRLALQYLTENGKIVFVKYEKSGAITEVSTASLRELTLY